jgi:large subunit ribosomal protein L6
MPIKFSSAKIEVSGKNVKISGPKASFDHELPEGVNAVCDGNANELKVTVDEVTSKLKCLWGLHRALLANKVQGAEVGFERKMKIVGLGLKAQLSGQKMTFSLGYSHKIDFDIPKGVEAEVDKTGQQLVFKAVDKVLLGNVCDKVRSFRKPEPYKGTGVMYEDEVIIRKAGKTKS